MGTYAQEHAENPCTICATAPGVRCEHDEQELLPKHDTNKEFVDRALRQAVKQVHDTPQPMGDKPWVGNQQLKSLTSQTVEAYWKATSTLDGMKFMEAAEWFELWHKSTQTVHGTDIPSGTLDERQALGDREYEVVITIRRIR